MSLVFSRYTAYDIDGNDNGSLLKTSEYGSITVYGAQTVWNTIVICLLMSSRGELSSANEVSSTFFHAD
jgi:hypothetical protein